MRAADVLAFLDLCDERGVRIWVDGGWGVDACLGEQTRAHADLDIAIERKDLDRIVDALTARGWRPVHRDDTSPWNFALGDEEGHQVDFHVVVFDGAGRGVMGPPERNIFYPDGSLTGTGTIEGRVVHCVSPEWLVRFHTGYPVDADDWADVSRLCQRFDLPIPADYEPYLGKRQRTEGAASP
jgi:lincosamide nucleotidyltransferase A/C/D/E